MPILETNSPRGGASPQSGTLTVPPNTAPSAPSGAAQKSSTANVATTPRQIMHFLYQNYPIKEIAESVNLSEEVVNSIVASEGFQLEYQKFTRARERYTQECERDVDSVLAHEQLDSVRTLAELRDTAFNEAVRLQAAANLLDRGGYGRVQRTEVTHTVYISDKQIERVDDTYDLVAKEGRHVFERHERGEIPGIADAGGDKPIGLPIRSVRKVESSREQIDSIIGAPRDEVEGDNGNKGD